MNNKLINLQNRYKNKISKESLEYIIRQAILKQPIRLRFREVECIGLLVELGYRQTHYTIWTIKQKKEK